MNVEITFFSTSFIPVVNAIQIKQDLKLTLSFTVILIFLILLVVFRSYILPFLFVLPAIFGMVFSLAVIYWFIGIGMIIWEGIEQLLKKIIKP